MDYIFLSSIIGVTLLSLIASYDIMCQWLKNFWKRMDDLPARLHLNERVKLDGKVPKLHLEMHQEACHAPYSFNFTLGAGRTNGEGVERNWAMLNGGAASTKEMGLGGHHDTIDDFCGFLNWTKMKRLGNTLLRRLVEAIPQSVAHSGAFEEFQASLHSECSEQVRQWEDMLTAWKLDHSKPCPYVASTTSNFSMAAVHQRMAEDEQRKAGDGPGLPHDTSPSAFLLLGIELEELQRSLRVLVKSKAQNPDVLHNASMEDRREVIRRRLERFQELQAIYMPALTQVLADAQTRVHDDLPAENVPLQMPSSLSRSIREVACISGLADQEAVLRHAQACDSLEDLHRELCNRQFLNKWKRKNITGQRHNTRARAWQHHVDLSVHAAAAQYRHARQALVNLRGPGVWENTLQELHDGDIRSPNERALSNQEREEIEWLAENYVGSSTGAAVQGIVHTGEGRRVLSWIWNRVNVMEDENSLGMEEALRIEWAKAKASADRWWEEVILLDEEMRHVLTFSDWKIGWWKERIGLHVDISEELEEGLIAYAHEHIVFERALGMQLRMKWSAVRERATKAVQNGLSDATIMGHSPDVDALLPAQPSTSVSTSIKADATTSNQTDVIIPAHVELIIPASPITSSFAAAIELELDEDFYAMNTEQDIYN
ncbi:hypothetical protein SCP_0403530 [Sparassis crispa]|uniref:Uncharacterized protein n=1 Tax=Sparassis crispa TaxID=139825 RepID=A0A401GIH5_9APHY|nr:hypothetical protein SCP_0403530 [Sparassis crispa]GBE81977.1 hypothetical protein SCP_0403530 [Sparassis crispa]